MEHCALPEMECFEHIKDLERGRNVSINFDVESADD